MKGVLVDGIQGLRRASSVGEGRRPRELHFVSRKLRELQRTYVATVPGVGNSKSLPFSAEKLI